MVYSVEEIKTKIRELGLRPARANGQNFIIEEEPLLEIIAAAEVKAGDHVLEIGPGLGALTEELLKVGARVTAIEYDAKMANFLRTTLAKKYPLEIIEGDARALADVKFLAGLKKYKIVANIPYHITSELIRQFTDAANPPTRMALLMQHEVAERVAAAPPDMNLLAFFAQWFASVNYVCKVPKNLFWPEPAVDSAIVSFVPGAGAAKSLKLSAAEQKNLFSLVKKGFSHPRKQLGNNLGVVAADRARLTAIDWRRRAETLTHAEWITALKTLS